jgi:hypothetical protein
MLQGAQQERNEFLKARRGLQKELLETIPLIFPLLPSQLFVMEAFFRARLHRGRH